MSAFVWRNSVGTAWRSGKTQTTFDVMRLGERACVALIRDYGVSSPPVFLALVRMILFARPEHPALCRPYRVWLFGESFYQLQRCGSCDFFSQR